jgi:hypothetical protein
MTLGEDGAETFGRGGRRWLGRGAGAGGGATMGRAVDDNDDQRWVWLTVFGTGVMFVCVVLLVCVNTGIIDMYRGLKIPTAFLISRPSTWLD